MLYIPINDSMVSFYEPLGFRAKKNVLILTHQILRLPRKSPVAKCLLRSDEAEKVPHFKEVLVGIYDENDLI